MGDRMNEEILYTRTGRNESKVNSDNDLQFCINSEKSKSDENISLENDNTNSEICLSCPPESSESVSDEEKVSSNDDDVCILGASPISLFQQLMDQLKSSRSKYNLDEHNNKCANIDMPLNWTEIASVLFFLSLKTSSFRRDRENTNFRIFEECISEMSDCFNPITDGMVDLHCVGSTAEGVDIPGHSDLDIMVVCKSFECYDGLSEEIYIHKNHTTKFISDRRNASSGYTLLWDIKNFSLYIDGDEDTFKMNLYLKYDNEDSLVTVSFPNKDIAFPLKNLLINQNKIKDLLRNAVPIPLSPIGPALHGTLHLPSKILQHLLKIIDFVKVIFDGKSELKNVEKVLDILKEIHVDIVWAVPFESKAIMQQWSERRRRHSWPTRELLQDISQMSGHVVPVGKKGSKFENYEFRICYTLAEIKLIRSLNEVQRLLFMILRVYAKNRKGAFPNISSYIIKNMILWLAESVEPSYFKPENMIPLIKSTLQVIKRCAEKGSLPNYMIPSRNLFDGKVEEKERQSLIDVLSDATKEGCDDILRQFDKSISEIIAGVRSDKLHTFVEKHKEIERKQHVLSKLCTELCHRHMNTNRNIVTTMIYACSLGGPRIILRSTQALLPSLIAPMCRIS